MHQHSCHQAYKSVLMMIRTLFLYTILLKGGECMFKLGKDSIIVQTWFAVVLNGKYKIEQVPAICGIREAVQQLLDEVNTQA